jgi:ribosomal subunit interface protein
MSRWSTSAELTTRMDVVIRDRTDHLPEQLRTYVDKKVRGLGDHLDLVTSADVEFDRDVKKRPHPLHVVKITLHLLAHRTLDLRVKETGRDQRATFDVAMTRMEAEAVQLKERIKAQP